MIWNDESIVSKEKYFCLNRSSSHKNTILSAPRQSYCVAVFSLSLFHSGNRHHRLSTKKTTIKWWEETSKEKEGIKSICILRFSLQLTPIIFLFTFTFSESSPQETYALSKTHAHINTQVNSHKRKNYSFFFLFFKKLSEYRNISSSYFYIAFVWNKLVTY